MVDMGTLLMEGIERETDAVGELLSAPTEVTPPTALAVRGQAVRGLSESDREAAVRLSKLAGAVVSLAVAAPFGAPAPDDPPAVVRAALELALLEWGGEC